MRGGGKLYALLRQLVLVARELRLVDLGGGERRNVVVGRRQPGERRRVRGARGLANRVLREERGDLLEFAKILGDVGHD